MKKNILFLLASIFTFSIVSARDIVTTDMTRLPQNARNFIATHFPNERVSYIKIDEELTNTSYDVVFESGTELEFMKDGEWKEIDTKSNPVPAAIIPSRIQQYIDQNFSGNQVREIKKKKRTYEVKLTNRLELEFDSNGNFKRIDD